MPMDGRAKWNARRSKRYMRKPSRSFKGLPLQPKALGRANAASLSRKYAGRAMIMHIDNLYRYFAKMLA